MSDWTMLTAHITFPIRRSASTPAMLFFGGRDNNNQARAAEATALEDRPWT